MAVKTFYLASGADGNFAALVDGTPQTAASRTDGWTVAKIAAANSAEFDGGTKQTSGAFSTQSGTPKPGSFLTGTTANAIKSPAALSGQFAATNWVLTFAVRASTASSQAGRIRLRVFKATNAAGTTGVVELTSATQVGTTSSALSTTTDVTSVVTWAPGAFTLNNEFLFFVIAWEITTASGSNSGDVVLRTGSAATPTGTVLVTPNLVALFSRAVTDSGLTPAAGDILAASRLGPLDRTLLDDFNRADGPVWAGAGAALWVPNSFGSSNTTSAAVAGNALTGPDVAVSTFWVGPDVDLLMDCVTADPANGAQFYFAMSATATSAPYGILVGYDRGSAAWWGTYYRGDGSGGWTLGSNGDPAGPQSGETYWVQRRGGAIKLYRSPPGGGGWALVGTWGDPGPTYGAGQVGFSAFSSAQRWDNFRGGPKANPPGLTIVGVVDTGLSISDSVAVAPTRAVSDYGLGWPPAPGSFPSTGVIDNFNRANGPLASALYTSAFPGLTNGNVTSNQWTPDSPGSAPLYSATRYGPDCEVYVTVVTPQTTELDLMARFAGPNGPGYYLSVIGSVWSILKWDPVAGPIQLATVDTGQVLPAGCGVGFRVVGSTLTAYGKPAGLGWSQVLTFTDPGSSYMAVGYVGFYATPGFVLEDFGGGALAPAASFGATPLRDNFNRADGSLGSNWAQDAVAPPDGPMVIVGNAATVSASTYGFMYLTAGMYGPDCEAWGTLKAVGAARLYLRIDDVALWGHSYWVKANNSALELYNQAGTSIGYFTQAISPGDGIGIRAVGNTISAWWRPGAAGAWVKIGEVTDTGSPGAGYVGMDVDSNSAAFDDFGGGNMVAAGGPFGDTIAMSKAKGRFETDQGLNMSVPDSIIRTIRRPLADTGLALTASLTANRVVARAVTDTGLSVSSAVRVVTARAIADQGMTAGATSSIQESVLRTRADTGLTVTDSIVVARGRVLTDTGLTTGSSLAVKTTRSLTDTGLAMSSQLGVIRAIALVDVGLGSPSGLVGAWALNENPAVQGTVIADSSGSGNAGTLTTNDGATNKSVPGQVGTAITFDGVDDVIDVPAGMFGFGAGDFTFSALIRNTSQASPGTVAAQDLAGTFGPFVFVVNIDINNTNYPGKLIAIVFQSDAVFYSTETAPGIVSPNVWHRVVYRRAAGVISIWVDGASIPLTPQSFGGATGGVSLNNTGTFRIGGRHYSGAFDPFTGDLDDVRLYSRALSDAEIVSGSGGIMDSIQVSKASGLLVRPITDTGLNVSEAVVSSRVKQAADTGLAVTDTLRAVGHVWNVADTGLAITDTVARHVVSSRALADTGLNAGSTLSSSTLRAVQDVGLAVGSALAVAVTRARADTGLSLTDSVVAGRVAPRAVADAGLAVTDTLKRAVVRSVSDTGLAFGEGLLAAWQYRYVADLGLAVSDSVVRVGQVIARTVADTGLNTGDSLVRGPLVRGRVLADAGLSLSEALTRSVAYGMADTGLTVSSTVVVQGSNSRQVTDNGLVFSEKLVRLPTRALSDAGLAITDSIGVVRSVALTDTGLNVSAAVAVVPIRKATDFGLFVTDSIHVALVRHGIQDTGLAISDSVAVISGRVIPLADTGLVAGDALKSVVLRAVADIGLAVSEARLALGYTRVLVDTGLTITDQAAAFKGKAIVDDGLSLSDSLARTAFHARAVTDGFTITDALALMRPRAVTDQGLTITESLGRSVLRTLADQITISDFFVVRQTRVLVDQGLNLSDQIRIAKGAVLNERGLTITDSLRSLPIRGLADIGLAISDHLADFTLRQEGDTGLSISETLRVGTARGFTDVGLAVSDELAARKVVGDADVGLTISDSIKVTRGAALALGDTGLVLTDELSIRVERTLMDTFRISDEAHRADENYMEIFDTALFVSDTISIALGRSLVVTDVGLALEDSLEARSAKASIPDPTQFVLVTTLLTLVLAPSSLEMVLVDGRRDVVTDAGVREVGLETNVGGREADLVLAK